MFLLISEILLEIRKSRKMLIIFLMLIEYVANVQKSKSNWI